MISTVEQNWVQKFEPKVKQFAVAQLGVDCVDAPAQRSESDTCKILYLGRIHPLKGLDLLITAWQLCQTDSSPCLLGSSSSSPRWRLIIAGPDEQGTLKQLKEQTRQMGLDESIDFVGPVYGEEKRRLMAACDVFVLPSRSENFGLVVAEALAAGKPVICTDAMPWQGVRDQRCGWVTPVSADGLAVALRKVMATPPDELAAMGARGRDWMKRDFSWRTCAETLLAAVQR